MLILLWMNLLVIEVEDLEGEEEVEHHGLLEIVLGMATINTLQCKLTLRSPMWDLWKREFKRIEGLKRIY